MATQKNDKPGNGRKIVILNREGVRKIFDLCAIAQTIWGDYGVSTDLLSKMVSKTFLKDNWKRIPKKLQLSQEEGRIAFSNLEKDFRNEIRSNWPKEELARFDKMGTIPIGDFAPILCDTATLLKQRVDRSGVYFQEYDGSKTKDVTEVCTGLDFVLEIGSFGLAYNDENFYDARGYDLSLLPNDIVGEVSVETLSYWKKRFKLESFKEFGDEFSFSPASLGTMLSKPNNIMRVDKWFQNEECIFNVLMVFYTLSKNERVYTVNPDANSEFYETCNTVSVEVPYVDVQLNVYTDALPSSEILEMVNDTFTNMGVFEDTNNQLSFLELEKATPKSRKYNSITGLKGVFIEELFKGRETSMICPDFGHSYRNGPGILLKDDEGRTMYEKDEEGNYIYSNLEKKIRIGIPAETTGLTRKVNSLIGKNGKPIREVLYVDETDSVVFRNGKPQKKKEKKSA